LRVEDLGFSKISGWRLRVAGIRLSYASRAPHLFTAVTRFRASELQDFGFGAWDLNFKVWSDWDFRVEFVRGENEGWGWGLGLRDKGGENEGWGWGLGLRDKGGENEGWGWGLGLMVWVTWGLGLRVKGWW
jgi:hypothetical protein